MGERRQKGGRKERNKAPKAFFLMALVLFGILVMLGLFQHLSNSTTTITAPVYEEVYSYSSHLNVEIRRIDNAIYESLYQRKVPEKNILFSVVKPRNEKYYDWDFTELVVKLPKGDRGIDLEKTLLIRLSQLKPAISIKTERISKIEVAFHIFTLGLYTHKLRLINQDVQKTDHRDLPKIAIIIDDLGYDRNIADAFIQMNIPLSLSILPLAPFKEYIASQVIKRGKELLLHLPMEPKNYPRLHPGPGTLLTTMDEKELRRMIGDHLKRVSGARGVNNHMGSHFTERRDKMAIVLNELKQRGLFYIDSRTTNQTVAHELAKRLGVPVASRNVFLDNDLASRSIRVQMERLLGIARRSGVAIGIGHPHKVLLEMLRKYEDKLKTGFDVVPVSKLVN